MTKLKLTSARACWHVAQANLDMMADKPWFKAMFIQNAEEQLQAYAERVGGVLVNAGDVQDVFTRWAEAPCTGDIQLELVIGVPA